MFSFWIVLLEKTLGKNGLRAQLFRSRFFNTIIYITFYVRTCDNVFFREDKYYNIAVIDFDDILSLFTECTIKTFVLGRIYFLRVSMIFNAFPFCFKFFF